MVPITSLLEKPTGWKIDPVYLGPTWRRNPDWDGVSKLDEYVLPERTLGWQQIAWVEANLQADEVDEYARPMPFKMTFEQKRFLLWWYAVDDRGVFVYREGVLQRLKGWG